MIILTTHEAVTNAIERYSQTVPVSTLQRYAAMMEKEPIAWLFILQPGDTAEHLAELRSQPFSAWEFIDHTDGWFTAVFVISDDGFGHVVIFPDQPDIDSELLSLCKQHATKAERAEDLDI